MAEKTKKEKKISKVMREFEAGKLKSSSGKKVTDKDQALAIAYSEARKAAKNGSKSKKSSTSSTKKAAPKRKTSSYKKKKAKKGK